MAAPEAVSSLLPHEGSRPANQILLGEYLRREELAEQLGVSTRTIDRWHSLRNGPPRIAIGRTILYNLDSVRDWLQARENTFMPLNNQRGNSRASRRVA